MVLYRYGYWFESDEDGLKKRLKILAEQPEIGKPLRNVLKGKRRIQIGSFVLIYEIDKNDNKLTLFSFEHHDSAYK
jgi:mRNA-degrading endonuclease RelE of RelBE toxin-antitoxin system